MPPPAPFRYHFGFLLLAIVLTAGCEIIGSSDQPDEGTEQSIPFEPIRLEGIDRVSIGGALQVVVRTQDEYDQLIYERYQKRLDDYWNEHYENTRQWIAEQNPGLSEEELEQRVRDAFYAVLPFRGTENIKHPDIDFTRYTLLGQAAHTGGCSAEWDAGVTKLEKTYTFRVQVTSFGSCEMAISRNVWGLTPRIDATRSVLFVLDYRYE